MHKHNDTTTQHSQHSCCVTSDKAHCHKKSDILPAEMKENDAGFRWKISGMDCPSCAQKIETAIARLAGVNSVRVIFATETLVVNASSDIRQNIEDVVHKAGYQLQQQNQRQPNKQSGHNRDNYWLLLLCTMVLLSWLLDRFNPAIGLIAFIITTLAGLYPIARKALQLACNGTIFSIEALMTIAATGALFINAAAEAAMVLILFMLGERLEALAAQKARRGVTALMALQPDTAIRIRGDAREEVPAEALTPGDIIEIAVGARLPADARLLSDHASFDQSALTGESLPVTHQKGDKIAAGATSVDFRARLEVTSRPGENAIDRILHLIEEAEERRAPIERFLDRFSRYYTPLIILLALTVTLASPLLLGAPWLESVYKGLTLLLIGCPCALVISTPAAITSALASATRRGILIKGGAALENLGNIRNVAFDKTGTLTTGAPRITDIIPLSEVDAQTLLLKAAAVESGASHPLAQAIIREADQLNQPLMVAEQQQVIAGKGISGIINDHLISITSPAYSPRLSEQHQHQLAQLESAGKTVVVISEQQQAIGLIALGDTLREDTAQAIEQLKKIGVRSMMLTGDNPSAAASIASLLGIDYQAGLLPEDKVTAVARLNQQQPTAMVGDGINDAPAMKAATIGIAMGGGTDVALETADAALTHNRLTELPAMIQLSRATRINIWQNITIALGLKAIFLLTTLLGITGLWLAILADSGATALVTANALRLLRQK